MANSHAANSDPKEAVIAACKACVGDLNFLCDDNDLSRYGTDWTRQYSNKPLAVVRPKTTSEVASIVQACRAYEVAIVPQGGRTGLCGPRRSCH